MTVITNFMSKSSIILTNSYVSDCAVKMVKVTILIIFVVLGYPMLQGTQCYIRSFNGIGWFTDSGEEDVIVIYRIWDMAARLVM